MMRYKLTRHISRSEENANREKYNRDLFAARVQEAFIEGAVDEFMEELRRKISELTYDNMLSIDLDIGIPYMSIMVETDVVLRTNNVRIGGEDNV